MNYLMSLALTVPDSKVNGAKVLPTWVLSAPDGPHVGPMNLATRGLYADRDEFINVQDVIAAVLKFGMVPCNGNIEVTVWKVGHIYATCLDARARWWGKDITYIILQQSLAIYSMGLKRMIYSQYILTYSIKYSHIWSICIYIFTAVIHIKFYIS